MRWILAGLAIVAIAILTDIRLDVARAQTPQPNVFDVTDTNHDGKITPDEYRARMVEVFFLLDRNKKGYLVKDDIPDVSDEAFRSANKKGDGKLSLEEYQDARMKDFDAADKAYKGFLTREDTEGQ
jgi:Ca2+-binding EF-hand superfamily protein